MPPVLKRCSLVLAAFCLLPSAFCAAGERISFSINSAEPVIVQGKREPVQFSIHAREERTPTTATPIAFSVHDAKPLDIEVANTDDEEDTDAVADVCQCGCGKPGCACQLSAQKAKAMLASIKTSKPVVVMRSASWCSVCRTALAEIEKAKDCPFDVRVEVDDNSRDPLPSFTWRVDGKLWTTTQPNTYPGLPSLIRQWESTQPKPSQQATRQSEQKPSTASQQPVSFVSPLENRITTIAQSTLRSPPPQMVAAANASYGNSSEAKRAKKKPSTRSRNGSLTSAAV